MLYKGTELVAKYVYDAWGNCTITHNVGNIANINPFRYRGYYYDFETGLYYLQSRYYDPSIGRFISPDSVEYLEPDNVLGLNLYAYCYNNPIMYADPSGHLAILISLIIGVVIGAGGAAYIDYRDDGQIFNGSVAWYDYLGAAALGGAIGAGLGVFAGMSFSASLPTFGWMNTGGALMFGVTGATTLTITGAQILGAAGLIGSAYMFSKGGLPNNKYQNQQWAEAMRQLGINDKDLWQRLHKEIGKYPYNTHDNLKKLINLLKVILKKWGKL